MQLRLNRNSILFVCFLLSIIFLFLSNLLQLGSLISILFSVVAIYVYFIESDNLNNRKIILYFILFCLSFVIVKEYFLSALMLIMYQIFLNIYGLLRYKRKDIYNYNYEKHYIINETGKKIAPSRLKPGDEIIVLPNQRIPIDGVIIKGSTSIRCSKIYGFFVNKTVTVTSEVYRGSYNLENEIVVKVVKTVKNSLLGSERLSTESVDIFSNTRTKYIFYSKCLTFIFLLLAVVFAIYLFISNSFSAYNFNIVLVLLLLSDSLLIERIIESVYQNSFDFYYHNGIRPADISTIDKLSDVSNIVFAKTGILTVGNLRVTNIVTEDEKNLLEYANCAEYYSKHKVAVSIREYSNVKIDYKKIKNFKETESRGVEILYKRKKILAGNYYYMQENKVDVVRPSCIGTIIYIAVNQKCLGYLVLSDMIKVTTKDFVQRCKKLGISNLCVLSGDNEKIVDGVCRELGISEHYSNLSQKDKIFWLRYIKEQFGENVCYVGDVTTDGVVLKNADIGISFDSGSDLWIVEQDLNQILFAIYLAKRTKQHIKNYFRFLFCSKIIFLVLMPFLESTLVFAVIFMFLFELGPVIQSLLVTKIIEKEV